MEGEFCYGRRMRFVILCLIKTSRTRRISNLQRLRLDSIEPCSRGFDSFSDGFSVPSARVRISCLRISLLLRTPAPQSRSVPR
jgi:hypothetical protein